MILLVCCGLVTPPFAASTFLKPLSHTHTPLHARSRPQLAPVVSGTHPLSGRRVFWYGFPFTREFVINFLQINEAETVKYKREVYASSVTLHDVLVVSGRCRHCAEFHGLIVYIDGEAGQLASSLPTKPNLIYLGVYSIHLPPLATHIKVIYGSSSLHYSSVYAREVFFGNRYQMTKYKSRFVAYAASKCVKQRDQVFDILARFARKHNLGEANALGKCGSSSETLFSNHSSSVVNLSRIHHASNDKIFRRYRYVLCMENADVPGYMTEKIFNAYKAGAIPIYWGASNIVSEIFHPDTWIHVDPTNVTTALHRVLQIERDPELYRRIMTTPVLLNGHITLNRHFALDIPLDQAVDVRKRKDSLSNYIWSSILARLPPVPADSTMHKSARDIH